MYWLILVVCLIDSISSEIILMKLRKDQERFIVLIKELNARGFENQIIYAGIGLSYCLNYDQASYAMFFWIIKNMADLIVPIILLKEK